MACDAESAGERRRFLAGSMAMAASLIAVPAFARMRGEGQSFGPVVETQHGKIRGFAGRGVHAFRGVPYGEATGGSARFRPARAARGWLGVRDTLGWGATAPQGASTSDPQIHHNVFALAEGDAPLQTFESEDCLTLNIWTPSVNDQAKRPVMLWLHGGGFWAGTAATAVHDGAQLAYAGDVVVISCNHRLNAFGFTHFDAPGFEGSGNAGMLDIVAALRWVRDNIARFGGDPGNVTIFGYSGGGQKVSALLAMPSARGLFHKAIIQSGQTPSLLTLDQARTVTQSLCDALGIAADNPIAAQAVSADRLLAAFRKVIAQPPRQLWGFPARFSPVVDGTTIPAQPLAPETLALSAGVPILIGNTRQEMAAVSLTWDADIATMRFTDLPAKIADYVGDKAKAVADGYRALYPDLSAWDLYALITADMPTRINSIRIAERRHAARLAPVYMYRVDWQTLTFDGRLKAPHGLEVPLIFRNVTEASGISGGGADAYALSETLSAAWVAFARTGAPSTAMLPWPAYEPQRRATMLFDRACKVVGDPDAGARNLLERLQIGRI